MMEINYPEGATPLSPEAIKGLIPRHITTQPELDRWEHDNINEALEWVENRKHKSILNPTFMKTLHKKMFCHVWRWAGEFRKTNLNIGVEVYNMSSELRKLFDDTEYWIENKTYPEDEIAARFHHKLVWIHLFPNGNGRHARLATDILLEHFLNRPLFTWGGANLKNAGDERKGYIDALKRADQEYDYKPLLEFVRS